MKSLSELQFDNTYARLGEDFFSWQEPAPFADLQLASANAKAAELLDLHLDAIHTPEFLQYLTGLEKWPGSEPLAMLYAGHQFGHWVPQLGDGRAILLGQVRNRSGQLWELQLKGSGPTPYSRGSDGRAVLRSTIREYLCAEAMHGLDIPTTRSLSMFHSQAPVYREEVETAAMLIRMAPTHVRFGSFEVFYHRRQLDKVKQLADYVIENYYPQCKSDAEPYAAFFNEVLNKTALMIAKWQAVGFAHGVMNTDNMSIVGLTLDYGPFGFMEAYQPGFICNHSDHHGRYAFNQQANIAMWNLICFGSALLDLIGEETARGIVQTFPELFTQYYEKNMMQKLGMQQWLDGDDELLQDLLAQMQQSHADYTITWRALSYLDFADQDTQQVFLDQFINRDNAQQFLNRYQQRLQQEDSQTAKRLTAMQAINPKYILRNYMAELAIRQAKQGDFSEVDKLLQLLHSPYEEHPDHESYAGLPPDWANDLAVSCSS